MSSFNPRDLISEVAGNPELYNEFDLNSLSLEQAIRLIQLHKMRVTHDEMVRLGSELKDRHVDVHELHKMLQLINKTKNKGEGADRGKLTLTHPDRDKPNVDFAHDLTKKLKSRNKPVPKDGQLVMTIDLSDPHAGPVREALEKAKALGMEVDIKDKYEGEETQQLLDAVRDITGIPDNETWGKVQDIRELRALLTKARDVYNIEFTWPADEFSSDECETLISAITTTCTDHNLQNEMQMTDLNRSYQERLEILQMARALVKTLHDDKVHKARSSSGR